MKSKIFKTKHLFVAPTFNWNQKIRTTDGSMIHYSTIRKLAFLIIGILVFSLGYSQALIVTPTSTQPSGSGSVTDPWQISNLAELRWISEQVEGGETFSATYEQFFVQTANIDASETADWDFNDDETAEGWLPIGFSGTSSNVRYDGHGYTISNLYINRPTEDYIGLFGILTGRLNNIKLIDVNITGKSNVGALLGKSKDAEKGITSCSASGTINGAGYYIGGLVGYIYGSLTDIENCHSSCAVTNSSTNYYTGGLIGYLTCNYTDTKYITSVKYSYSTGDVTSSGDYVGGLIGRVGNYGSAIVKNSFSTGDVTGVSNGTRIGAFCGYVKSNVEISNCYTTGSVYGPSTTSSGFVGYDGGCTYSNNYFDLGSNQTTATGASGLSTENMKNSASYTNWDFDYVWDTDVSINDGYPYLFISKPISLSGSGTEADPYLISTLDNLHDLSMRSEFWGLNYWFKQTANIDASTSDTWNAGTGFRPIGSDHLFCFCGNYDGDGYAIDQLYGTSNSYKNHMAFFEKLNGRVDNLGLTNLDFTASGDASYAAGMMGTNGSWLGKAYNCYTTGTITGTRAGGFVGYYTGSGIYECYSTCDVTANEMSGGGFVSHSRASIYNSYCTGNVTRAAGSTSTSYGGFAGELQGGNIYRSFSTGKVIYSDDANPVDKGFNGESSGGNAKSCMWNISTSLQSTNAANTTDVHGMTTAQMQDYNNFTKYSNGFLTNYYVYDFVTNPNDDHANNNYWDMDQDGNINNGFPILSWQDGADDILEYIMFTWVGTDGSPQTDWNTAANWDIAEVPNSSSASVIIPSTPNKPVISSGAFDVSNITIESEASLTINNGASLNTRKDLALKNGASLIDNGTLTINGSFSAIRNIDESQWHLISSPVTNAKAGIFDGQYLQQWDESTALWSDVTGSTTALPPAKGFSLWSDAGGEFVFTGTPNTGEVSLAYGGGKGPVSYDYKLLGNPYPSSIDWSMLDDSYGAVYYWDQDNNRYASWNNGSGNNGGVQYVMPCQGFFIAYADNGSGTFTVNNTCRTHEGSTFFKGAPNQITNSIRLQSSGNNYKDESLIIFDEQASADFQLKSDAVDMKSGINGMPELYSCYGDNSFSIDARPRQNEIQLGFSCDVSGDYSISLKESSDFNSIILWDTKQDVKTNLIDESYSFDFEAGEDDKRFKLLFGTTDIAESDIPTIQTYILGNNIIIKSQTTAQRIILTDITGRTLGLWEGVESIPAPKTAGVYLVSIESEGQRITEKLIVE